MIIVDESDTISGVTMNIKSKIRFSLEQRKRVRFSSSLMDIYSQVDVVHFHLYLQWERLFKRIDVIAVLLFSFSSRSNTILHNMIKV